jgi:hypothetical protein
MVHIDFGAASQAARLMSPTIGERRSRRGQGRSPVILLPIRMTTGPWMMRLSSVSVRFCTVVLLPTSPETKRPGRLPGSAMVTIAAPARGSALVSLSRCGREGNARLLRASDGDASLASPIHVVLLSALVVVHHPYAGARHASRRTLSAPHMIELRTYDRNCRVVQNRLSSRTGALSAADGRPQRR